MWVLRGRLDHIPALFTGDNNSISQSSRVTTIVTVTTAIITGLPIVAVIITTAGMIVRSMLVLLIRNNYSIWKYGYRSYSGAIPGTFGVNKDYRANGLGRSI